MMQKKRICLVIASPLTINFFLLGHIQAIAKAHDLTVITNTHDSSFLDYLGVPLRVIPLQIERDVSVWLDIKALIALAFIFHKQKFDLIHSLSPKTGLLGMLSGWMVRAPIRIHTFQGEVWVTRKGLWRAFLKFLDKVTAKCATHLLVVSKSERQFLVGQQVVAANRLQIIANGSICGVDLNKFRPSKQTRNDIRAKIGLSESDLVILYVGRLNADKGLLDLAEAFSKASLRCPNIHLLVVGPDEDQIEAKMTALCPDYLSKLHFFDFTPHPELYMAASDILCLPSYREGFGLVLIEAAACGLPTIASRIYGITDAVVDLDTGLLFDVGDINDLTIKIEALVADADLRKRLGVNGKSRAESEFSKDLVISEFMTYYAQLLKCSKRPEGQY